MDKVKTLLERAAALYAEADNAPPSRKRHLIALAKEYLARAEDRSAQKGEAADLIDEAQDIDADIFPLGRRHN